MIGGGKMQHIFRVYAGICSKCPKLKYVNLWGKAHIFPEIMYLQKSLVNIQSIWTNIHIENNLHKMDLSLFNTF